MRKVAIVLLLSLLTGCAGLERFEVVDEGYRDGDLGVAGSVPETPVKLYEKRF